jgi:hypothetical protein
MRFSPVAEQVNGAFPEAMNPVQASPTSPAAARVVVGVMVEVLMHPPGRMFMPATVRTWIVNGVMLAFVTIKLQV